MYLVLEICTRFLEMFFIDLQTALKELVLYFMGMTGFDSKISRIISMSSHEIVLVKIDFTFLNGENNYALAA